MGIAVGKHGLGYGWMSGPTMFKGCRAIEGTKYGKATNIFNDSCNCHKYILYLQLSLSISHV